MFTKCTWNVSKKGKANLETTALRHSLAKLSLSTEIYADGRKLCERKVHLQKINSNKKIHAESDNHFLPRVKDMHRIIDTRIKNKTRNSSLMDWNTGLTFSNNDGSARNPAYFGINLIRKECKPNSNFTETNNSRNLTFSANHR